MATIRFGSNTFSAQKDFTIIGVGKSGGLVFGGFGPAPTKKVVWVRFEGKDAFLNAELRDADGELVLKIENSTILLNKDNIYSIKQLPENKIPPDSVLVVNKYGETAMALSRQGGVWEFNGDFYFDKYHIVATEKGTIVNPSSPQV